MADFSALPARLAFSLLSPSGPRARLSILIFHRVLPRPDPIFPSEPHAASFDAMMGWLRQCCQVLPLDDAVRRLREGSLPARAAAITFDDGYADNHEVAMPILQRHGLSATFFVATGFLDGGQMWNDTVGEAVRHCQLPVLDLGDLGLPGSGPTRLAMAGPAQRRQAISALIDRIKYCRHEQRLSLSTAVAERAGVCQRRDLMMSSQQVRGLRDGGMLIGAHTHNHPILAKLQLDAARDEIERSKRQLEDLLSEQIKLFAYPNGVPGTDYVAGSVACARSLGFEAAVSTSWGAAHQGSDPFQLPRFTPWDRTAARFYGRLAANLRRPGLAVI